MLLWLKNDMMMNELMECKITKLCNRARLEQSNYTLMLHCEYQFVELQINIRLGRLILEILPHVAFHEVLTF
jgi:hypothetical protein